MSVSAAWIAGELVYLACLVGWIIAIIWPHYKPSYVFSLKDQSNGWLACRYLVLIITSILLPEAWQRCDNLQHQYWTIVYMICAFTLIAAVSSYDFVAWILVIGCTYLKSRVVGGSSA
jgi:hypothetical protein